MPVPVHVPVPVPVPVPAKAATSTCGHTKDGPKVTYAIRSNCPNVRSGNLYGRDRQLTVAGINATPW